MLGLNSVYFYLIALQITFIKFLKRIYFTSNRYNVTLKTKIPQHTYYNPNSYLLSIITDYKAETFKVSEVDPNLFWLENNKKNSIQLQLDDPTIKIALHIFQELLMIFTDGMKYLYGNEGGVNITTLTEENMKEIDRYFESMGFNVFTESFTIADYLSNMKLYLFLLYQ